VILAKRPVAKSFAATLLPSMLTIAAPNRKGASAAAIRHHYDLSNDFYRTWLGPSMMYSSGLWAPHDDPSDLAAAHDRKIDYFATLVLSGGDRVLDVGCGWGGNLRALRTRHGVVRGVGLTLSDAQRAYIAADPIDSVEIRVEDWADHDPVDRYDAIFSYGAFEHFARDGSSGPERVSSYRHFFASCHRWLRSGGRIALETIAHDAAPDTVRPLGRGPRGDSVLALFPESIAPHLAEVVLGFEPWFEVEVLRSDAADFARTFRCWQVRLRRHEQQAEAVAGADTVRRYRRYLASSELQFRDGTLTNLRLVLRRRDAVKR
jgi:cyclopropane-fatty-acyl-phospholipid synthase